MTTDHERSIILEKLAAARAEREALVAAHHRRRRKAERLVGYWQARLEDADAGAPPPVPGRTGRRALGT